MRWFIVGIMVSCANVSSLVFACEPCSNTQLLSLGDMVQKAEFIVIGARHNPPAANDNNSNNGPEIIDVAVEKVLKGAIKDRIIKTASWSGMCAYGVVLYKEKALLFLRQVADYYSVVDAVCGENQYTIVDNKLARKSMRQGEVVYQPFMSLDTFIDNYHQSLNKEYKRKE